MTNTDLAALSDAATQGEWRYYRSAFASGTSIRASDELTAEGLCLCDQANAAFIVALVNAYRSGDLVLIDREGMRERVAKAICKQRHGHLRGYKGREELYEREADAAIAAITGRA
jgi:hypothetical protein